MVYQVKGRQSGINLSIQSINEPVPREGSGGILPPSSSMGSLDFIRYPALTKSDLWHGWSLPGLGKARDECGECRHKGCLNSPKHPDGKIFVKAFRSTCCKASCPVCWKNWSVKEAHRASHRMRSFRPDKYRAPIHVMFSPPNWMHVFFNYKEMKKMMYKLSKTVGLYGGLSIFHPFRCDTAEWYWSPHFHTIGYGWIHGTKEVYEDQGWVIKNIGVRKDVVRVVSYALSHAGIREGNHAVTWFGELSYAKLKVELEPDDENKCPFCLSPLVLLQWVGINGTRFQNIATDRGPPIPEDYEGLMDPEGWELKISEWQLGRSGLDVDSARQVMMKNYAEIK